MNFETLELKVNGDTATILLNQPEKLNPLSTQALEELASAAQHVDTFPDVKVVTVSGAGRAFSAGADVSAFASSASAPFPRNAGDAGRRMADAIEAMKAVAVAKIHGWCVGGGLVVAAACDLRLAAEDAMFSIPEVDLGIPLAWGGIPRLVREIGPALTKELVMTCRPFDASEAKAAGFLNRVVPADQLDQAVADLVETLASKPLYALTATKAHTNAVTAQMVGVGHAWSDADGLMAGLRDPEGKASAKRYLERMASK
jgi:enoyl-CoA hydratase/carnithine racemase